jgi:hypothetical protein
VLLFYSKSNIFTWNRVMQEHDEEYLSDKYKFTDARGRYSQIVLTGPGTTKGASGEPWRNYNPTKAGRHWAVPKRAIAVLREEGCEIPDGLHDQLELLFEHDFIYFPQKQHGVPRFKLHLQEGQPIQDIIVDIPPINSQAKERLGYPTQKPLALMERIIKSSSNEGDLVLDAYCGCGTTVAAAQNLGRRWIGMDITFQAISVIMKRIQDVCGKEVADTVCLAGIPRDMESAVALAHKKDDRLRKEFEKWAILVYTMNRAVINDKKGADGGIDGIVKFLTTPTELPATMVFQVKSGKVSRGDIPKLNGDRLTPPKAALATLITLEEPTKDMRSAAKATGSYTHPFTGKTYDCVQIVTIREIIEGGKRLDLPLILDALKVAPKPPSRESQAEIDFEKHA